MDISLRPLTRSDIDAWAGLLAAVEVVDATGEHSSAADLAEEMANPDLFVGKDFVGAFDGDDMVGYCSVLPWGAAEDQFRVLMHGTVLPTSRDEGIGTRLVQAMVERARELHREREPRLRGRVTASGPSANIGQAELLTAAGFVAERWTFVMRTALVDLPELRRVPAGYEIRAYDDSLADALRETHNIAFLDHPNFTPWTAGRWKQHVTESRSFRPDICYVVMRAGSDEIVSYLQSAEFDAYFETTGRREAYVGKVGTLREHRGHGLAGALLTHALHGFRAAGYDEASLDVDSANPTGALGIYQRTGFEVESRWTNYALEVPAPG